MNFATSNRLAAAHRWREHERATFGAVTETMLLLARAGPGMSVLDVACGTGEPALSLAAAVGTQGRVTASDLSAGLTAIAAENAQRDGNSNVSFRQADVHDLPFPDHQFDLVTCRFGVMFFRDPARGLRECRRVLRPGGRLVLAAWGPTAQNGFFTTVTQFLMKYTSLSAEDSGALEPYRFAEEGRLSAAIREAGFEGVEEMTRMVAVRFPGSPEEFWSYRMDMSPPFPAMFEAIAAEDRGRVKEEILAAVGRHYDGQQVLLSSAVVFASAGR